jgi:hypothetical protein
METIAPRYGRLNPIGRFGERENQRGHGASDGCSDRAHLKRMQDEHHRQEMAEKP